MQYLAPALLLLTAVGQPTPSNQIDWRWQRDTPICSLRQVFAADGSTIQISRTPGTDGTSFRIGGYEGLLPTRTSQEEELSSGAITLESGEPLEADILTITDSGRRDVSAGIDSDVFARFAKSSAVEITHDKIGKVQAPVRSAAAAVEAIRNCEDSKLREWGIDPIAWRALKARPVPTKNWTEWLSTDDYPVGAILKGIEGFVISRLDVGPDGVARTCVPLNRNRAKQQRSPICDKLKKRARFKPALDSDGNPVAAPYVLVIQFRLA